MHTTEDPRRYIYSAYANSIGAAITLPHKTALSDVPCAALPPGGGFVSQTRENIVLNIGAHEILRIGRATASVHGELRGDNFLTWATVTIEDLNILGVVTADLVTNRVTSLYPAVEAAGKAKPADPDNHKSTFSLGGSHFVNLRAADRPVKLTPLPQAESGFKVGKSFKPPTSLYPDSGPLNIHSFGTIYFGEIIPYNAKVIISMLRIELGCAVEGCVDVASASANGWGPHP